MTDLEDLLDEPEPTPQPDRAEPTRWLRIIAVVPAILLVVVAGRAWLGDDDAVHADGEGILSAQPGPGTVGFHRADPKQEFWGTFGAYRLCLDEGADAVELTGFDFDSMTEPRELYVGVRTLTPRQVATSLKGDERIDLVAMSRGRPPEFRYAGGSTPAPGTFRRGLDGVAVETDCDDVERFGFSDMGEPMRELLVVVRAGPQGAYISGLDIDYEADGSSYTLHLDTDLAICGSRVTVCDSA